MSDKAIIQKLEPYKYLVPIYTVVDGKGIELVDNTIAEGQDESGLLIDMLRGSKIEGENTLPKIDGILPEQLIAVCIDHLKAVNVGDLANRETSVAITKLEEAGLWLMKREADRKRNNVLGTYQKIT